MSHQNEAVELVTSRSVLTPTSGYLQGFTHSLNPYMGCAFGAQGCGVYCYVAESPIGLHAGRPWGTWIKAKTNAAEALERDLRRIPNSSDLCIFMSSATDPYQPAESKLRITRSVLKVLERSEIALLVVQTRSPLVERDFDLLQRMPFVWLSMTIETDDDRVRRALTPTCPAINRRLRSMRLARDRGIRVQAAVSPVLPHDPERLADQLAGVADRVVIDTFLGDGANGRRTKRRPLPKRFVELGLGDWQDTTSAKELFRIMAGRMGRERVDWSEAGFNRLAINRVAGNDVLARQGRLRGHPNDDSRSSPRLALDVDRPALTSDALAH
jgi:DNA repair photolyase